MKIKVKCPTRIDLAGGTLDLWPLYALIPGSQTINAAIEVYTSTELVKRNDSKIKISIKNLGYEKEFLDLNKLLKDKNEKLAVVRPLLNYFKPNFGFELTTFSESPIGGGLGGSSSLMITLITAFLEATEQTMSPEKLVYLAHNLEAQILKTPTGTQDYVPPILGGVCCIRHEMDGLKFEKLSIDEKQFNDRFLLVYTGRPHHSGLNNWEVYKKAIDKSKKTLNALEGIKRVTEKLYSQIKLKDLNFKNIFKVEYGYRTKLAKSFSSSEIKKLEKLALKSGAQAIKILGAGGGGCVIIWCDPSKKERLKNLCEKEKFLVLKAQLSSKGIEVQKS